MDWLTYSFEKLEAWVKAKEFAKTIYSVTHTFPKDEKFGLSQQLKRASVSIASNIAEGSGRKSPKDKAHFSVIAFSSLLEVVNQLILAYEFGLIDKDTYKKLRKQAQETSYLINALHKSQISSLK
ncbi:MAG: four helix bundle protein [Saprospirales bacterium]|nr:four helix bundle protein [Saprospirales bacterium]